MNWIPRIFLRKNRLVFNPPAFQRNVKQQVDYKIRDLTSLVEYNRGNIKLFCKDPIIEWSDDGKEKYERLERRARLEAYEMFLLDRIEMLRILRDLENNCN